MFKRNKQHLIDNNETYFGHMRGAFWYGPNCFKAGCIAFTHGLLPGVFQTDSSNLVKHLSTHTRKDS